MSLHPKSTIILITALVGAALIVGMMLLTLMLGANHPLNRRFALLLSTYLVANGLAILAWAYYSFRIELTPEASTIILKLLGVTVCTSSYTSFLFATTLTGNRPWSRSAKLGLGAAALLLSAVMLFNGPPAIISDETVLGNLDWVSSLFIAYLALSNISLVAQLWQSRRTLPHPLFSIGLLLFVLASLLVPLPPLDGTGIPLLLGTIAAILVTIAMVRLQVLNPLAAERSQLASDRDRLLRVNAAVGQMLDETDLQGRLRLMARGLNNLGWRKVCLALLKEQVVIVEPSTPAAPSLKEIETRWQQLKPEERERQKVGVGYFLPAPNTPPLPDYDWKPGDTLILPLYMSDGQLAALIELTDPADGRRPTEETMRPLGILAAQARSAIENNRLLYELTQVAGKLQDQVEELVMMQRVDQELSATLNFDNVMMLTMDWAIRRTGASAGMLNMMTPDGTALYPVAALGYPMEIAQKYGPNNPLPLSQGVVGRAIRTRQVQVVQDTSHDPDYVELLTTTRAEVAVPMEMRGRVLGVLSLETDQAEGFDTAHIFFIQRLAARAVVAMDNARLYREAEGRADEMAALYSAGRAISSSLERDEVLINAAQSLAAVLSVSSAILADYRSDRDELVISAVYRLGTARLAREALPAVGDRIDLTGQPELLDAIRQQRVLIAQSADTDLPTSLRDFVTRFNCNTVMVAPLFVQDQTLGVIMAVEGRRPRRFLQDDMLMAESVASQAASALRQARLYEDVRELENMKSEMIRMASHDLRNPLGNAMGYFELLVMTLGDAVTEKMSEYVGYVRHSTNAMNTLIEDLLTLERIESERQAAWKILNLGGVVYDVVEAQRASAQLKQQTLTLNFTLIETDNLTLIGSTTQIRQAVSNLVSNGIKYTPENGKIQVRLTRQAQRLVFEVEDNGYGISPERQARLFQRFYRAREPQTDHIPGTGLGLSLVKTVVERHGGEVWVKSELNQGSTFGFWLPAADGSPENSPAQLSESGSGSED